MNHSFTKSGMATHCLAIIISILVSNYVSLISNWFILPSFIFFNCFPIDAFDLPILQRLTDWFSSWTSLNFCILNKILLLLFTHVCTYLTFTLIWIHHSCLLVCLEFVSSSCCYSSLYKACYSQLETYSFSLYYWMIN